MAELRVGASTHKGQVRPENEDNLLVTDRLFVVADGMGGHEAGEVASQLAVDRIGHLLDGDEPPSAPEVVQAIRVANGDIFRAAIANPGHHGMGTTVTAIAVIADAFAGRAAPNIDLDGFNDTSSPDGDGDGETPLPGDVTPVVPAEPSEALVLANVGDSRTYLFRHGRLRRVTVDHSYVQELVATGHITEDEARDHPRRNIITRALGIEPEVRVDWWTLPLIRGDRFVLCSDGLVDEVADVDIASTLATETDPQVAADRLVDQANEAGGRDNITVVVLDVLEGDDPPDPTQELDLVPVWAETGTDPTPAGTLELDPDADSPFVASSAATDGDDDSSPAAARLRGSPSASESPLCWWSSSSCSRSGRAVAGSSRSTIRTRR
jgi:PPM family protein phosphatase